MDILHSNSRRTLLVAVDGSEDGDRFCAFLQNDFTEEDVRLTGFSQSTKTSDGYTIETLEYRFSVKGKTFPVVYHREEGEWRLCPDCTPFS